MVRFGLKQCAPVVALLVFSLASAASAATAYINQVGYRVGDVKEFTLFEGSGNVEIVDASGKTVLRPKCIPCEFYGLEHSWYIFHQGGRSGGPF